MSEPTHEVNFDGLVGPTHNYAGLSWGNVASQRSAQAISNPKGAALQGLEKMRRMLQLGLRQAVLPPHERPDVNAMRRLGFGGNDAQVVEQLSRSDLQLLSACYSASSMWTANAATVSPSADTADHRLHLTPANLISQLHRSLESSTTLRILRRIFDDEGRFAVHEPLNANLTLSDEGAANHMRLCPSHGQRGLEIFVFGREGLNATSKRPKKFPARQTREASASITRLHQLERAHTLFIQQNPAAIDAGVFHNDVIAVGNVNVLLYHECAYDRCDTIQRAFESVSDSPLVLLLVKERDVPLSDVVDSYLFNSQLVSLPDDSMCLVHPRECLEIASTNDLIERILADDNPITSAQMVEVRQSMKNGGGPACLRLRVVMTEAQIGCAHSGVFVDDPLLQRLSRWVDRHYRDQLAPADLADPKLIEESRAALDDLTQILDLGSIYDFQM